jgi:hypothetical protein
MPHQREEGLEKRGKPSPVVSERTPQPTTKQLVTKRVSHVCDYCIGTLSVWMSVNGNTVVIAGGVGSGGRG